MAQTIVAIDGTVGSGKSTVARLLARRLGYLHIDTGAMYRAVAWAALQEGVDADDAVALARLVADLDIRLEPRSDGLRVWCNERDVTEAIRDPEVSRAAARVADHAEVRHRLVALQREMGRRQSAVMEGRDIGTVVFPDATHKFFLDAAVETRAARRARELELTGRTVDAEAVLRDVQDRDRRDRQRAVGALRQAPDAILIDTTHLSIDDVVDLLAAHIADSACGFQDPAIA